MFLYLVCCIYIIIVYNLFVTLFEYEIKILFLLLYLYQKIQDWILKTKKTTEPLLLVVYLALTETIRYYGSKNSPVYVLLIDESKAFDRVCHIKWFHILHTYGVCLLILRVLYNIYTNSEMQVRWDRNVLVHFH